MAGTHARQQAQHAASGDGFALLRITPRARTSSKCHSHSLLLPPLPWLATRERPCKKGMRGACGVRTACAGMRGKPPAVPPTRLPAGRLPNNVHRHHHSLPAIANLPLPRQGAKRPTRLIALQHTPVTPGCAAAGPQRAPPTAHHTDPGARPPARPARPPAGSRPSVAPRLEPAGVDGALPEGGEGIPGGGGIQGQILQGSLHAAKALGHLGLQGWGLRRFRSDRTAMVCD